MTISISEANGGCLITVRVLPRSSRNQVAGEQDGVLKVKITAPPVDGEANKCLCTFLADVLKIPRTRVTIQHGETARVKTVRLEGVSPREVRERLGLPG